MNMIVQERRSTGVSGSNRFGPMAAEAGGCDVTARGVPGVGVKAARIAGYGFIAVGVLAGAIALVIILVGGILMLPSIVSAFRRSYARYSTSPTRMLKKDDALNM
jgi:hypothetical protein